VVRAELGRRDADGSRGTERLTSDNLLCSGTHQRRTASALSRATSQDSLSRWDVDCCGLGSSLGAGHPLSAI